MEVPNSFLARTALLILLVMPPLLAGLGAADCEYHMEVMTLASSQETWMRMQSDPDAWLIPSWNGAPRVNKPPLTVWINAILWSGIDPATANVDELVMRARMAAAGLTFLALFAVWSIGARLYDERFGWLAAVVVGTSLLFLRTARIATYDTYLLVFSTCAAAGALHAIRPNEQRTPPLRTRTIGWTVFGLASAAAYLTKGPISLVMTLIPALCFIACMRSWRTQLPGLALALLGAAALTAPWYLHVLREIPAAARVLGVEYKAARSEFQPPWYYFGLVSLVAPWSLWLPAFWAHAIRRRLDWGSPAIRIGAGWFLAIFIIMSIPAAKQQRYIVPILPAAGLLMASAILSIGARTRAPWLPRLARIHGGILVAASALIGVFGLLHPWLLEIGALKRPEIALLPPWSLALLAALLVYVARAVLRAARKDALESMAALTAAWMTLASTPLLFDYSHTHHGRYQRRAEVEQVMRIVKSDPLRYAESPELPDYAEVPDGKMLMYARRIIPLWTRADGPPSGFLMAARHDGLNRELEEAGWRPVLEFDDGNLPRRLYRASLTNDR